MRTLLIAMVGLLVAGAAHAVDIEWVTVGDPWNACDPQPQGCFGAVAYEYRISKYEVINAQYAEFLNAVAGSTDTYDLYSQWMGEEHSAYGDHGGITRSGSSGSYTYSTRAGRESMPVNYVSWYDSLRFANWLHNGQPTGVQDSTTTEDGAYTFSGATSVGARNAGATVFLTSEDEWYKAAYYDVVSMSYFDYPAGSDTPTTCAAPGTMANTANCSSVVGNVTDVGSYTGAASPNGTFDQGGNLGEWNETIIDWRPRFRGGDFEYDWPGVLAASIRGSALATGEIHRLGFRVASIPEPPMEIDIKPWSDINPIHPFAEGVIPVAILTTEDFDALTVDADSVLFGPADAEKVHRQAHVADVNDDGFMDLLLHYRTQDTGIAMGDTEACVTGETFDGVPLEGCDMINTQPPGLGCGVGFELAFLLPPLLWLRQRRGPCKA